MCSYSQLLSLILIYLSIFIVNRVAAESVSANLPRPSEDPFYTPPSGFEKAPLGQILKSRKLPHGSLSVYSTSQNVKDAYQFLYRTTGALGQPISTITTVMIPYNADDSKLVSYQMIQDSVYQDCTASYVYHTPYRLNVVVGQLEMLAMDSFLQRGWSVCVPDHGGPYSLFASSAMAGHATLDGIRAVLASGNLTHIRSDADVQLFGYSAGAFATGSAAELQPTYAPELNNSIIAASLGGIPVNVNATFAHSNNNYFTALSFVAMNSYMLMDKDFANYINSILRPEKRDEFFRVRQLCFSEVIYQYSYIDLNSFFTRPDYADHPVVAKVLNANRMGQAATPTIPLFIYQGQRDEVTPYSDVEAMYNKWCGNGANIEMVKDGTARHVPLFFAGLAGVLQNIEQRFKNPHLHTGCSTRWTRSMIFDHGSVLAFIRALAAAIHGLRGLPLGPENPDSEKWLSLAYSWLAPTSY